MSTCTDSSAKWLVRIDDIVDEDTDDVAVAVMLWVRRTS